MGWRTLIALTAAGSLAFPAAAVADDIRNNLDTTLDATAEVMALNAGGAAGTTTLSVVTQNGDGKNGCNLTGSTTLVVAVSSSDPGVATVSPSSLTFTSCGDTNTVTVTPVSQGTSTVTLSQTSNTTGGTFNLAPATFTVNVAPGAPSNTAPSVQVTGVTEGATYDKGDVPTATCQVADAEDGSSSFAATLSAVTGPHAADGIGQQTATCSYTDAGGLNAVSAATYTIVDPSAPVIGYTLDPATPDGDDGWYTGDVTLNWTVAEGESPGSLVKTGCVDQVITADQAATTYSCSATSAGGAAAEQTVTIKRDGSAPNMPAVSVSPEPNDDDWNNSDVTVSFAPNGDNGPSGDVTCTSDVIVDEETLATGRTVSGTCTDAAGNQSEPASVLVKLDKTGPVVSEVSTVTSGTEGDNGWYVSDVEVEFTATDALSGITTGTKTVTSSGEGAAVEVASPAFTDVAGNTTPAGQVTRTFKIDKSAPNPPTVSLSADANPAGWHNADVTVSFQADGDNGPSGNVTCTADVTVDENTPAAGQVVSGTCTDEAGNESAATEVTVKLDKDAPLAPTATADPAPNTFGWNNTAVTVSFTDNGDLGNSGVATCAAPVTVSAETDTDGQDVSGTCTDVAGNESAPASATVRIDQTDPTVSLVGGPQDGAEYYFGFVPGAPTCDASDVLSGLDGSCSVSGHGTAVGSHTVTATATDRAGNVGSDKAGYTVKAWEKSGYYRPVDMGGVWNTVKNGSTVPLKFELFAGATELTQTSRVTGFSAQRVDCPGPNATTDVLEEIGLGGTALRYDSTAGQFIQNWQTPKKPGTCWKAVTSLADGSTISANFLLK